MAQKCKFFRLFPQNGLYHSKVLPFYVRNEIWTVPIGCPLESICHELKFTMGVLHKSRHIQKHRSNHVSSWNVGAMGISPSISQEINDYKYHKIYVVSFSSIKVQPETKILNRVTYVILKATQRIKRIQQSATEFQTKIQRNSQTNCSRVRRNAMATKQKELQVN